VNRRPAFFVCRRLPPHAALMIDLVELGFFINRRLA